MRDVDGPRERTDDRAHADGRDAAVKARMNDPNATSFEKALAAFIGAAEGFAEEARKANLPALAKQAADVTSETFREVRGAIASENGPVDPALAGAATLATEDYIPYRAGEELATSRHPLSERIAEGTSRTLARAENVASRLSESGRRALEAPPAIGYHIKTATRELAREAADAGLGFVTAGVFGFFSLAFFSVVVAVALNAALGGQVGTFLVGAFYFVVACVLGLLAARAVRAAKEDARRGVDNVKAEARAVTRPLKGLRA